MFAIPIWTLRKDQRIGVVNLITRELTIFQEIFGVLYLRTFDRNVISGEGYPSKFDIQKKRVGAITKLVETK